MKTNTLRYLAAVTLTISCGLTLTQASVPLMISYQGLITANGEPFKGEGYFKFALLDGDSMIVWSNDGAVDPDGPKASVEVWVEDGLFSVMLGDSSLINMEPIGAETFAKLAAVALRIWFSADDETFILLTPDQPIGAVGYAMLAERVPPNTIGSTQLAPNAVGAPQILNGAVIAGKLAVNSVAGANILNNTITSNKIDWTTMPDPVLGYAERGPFATAPLASGNNAIALGYAARAIGDESTVSGGKENTAEADFATIGGGAYNLAQGQNSLVAGGHSNLAISVGNVIGGGASNRTEFSYAVVSGGSDNTAIGAGSSIGGGQNNLASNVGSRVSGGWYNHARGVFATVGGGDYNIASNRTATIGGGHRNRASALDATVSGGWDNHATGEQSAIGGGRSNHATGQYAAIPGGYENAATTYAFAAGRRAKANHEGAFVWGDATNADIASTADNSVTFRCHGGVRFTSGGEGVNETVAWAPGAGSWTFSSDESLKEDFTPVDAQVVLEKVAALPLTEWNYVGYKQRHIGPMAQDFHAAFPLVGSSDTAINSLHLDGVALAAIQGLYAEVSNQKSEVSRLQAENAELKARLERLEAMLMHPHHD